MNPKPREVEDDGKARMSRRAFGIALGSSFVLGAGGIASLGLAFSAAGPPGSITVPTSFGRIRIALAERQSRLPGDANIGGAHAGHGAVSGRSAQPINMTFGDHVLVRLDVFNESEREQMFSPGQLRLRGNSQPWLVVNRWNDLAPVLMLPGTEERAKISFLVPSDSTNFTAFFDDIANPGGDLVEVPMPPVKWRPGFLESSHV
ncbi:hypothetical protein [Arthrobacter sp. MYb213]|uniref:hypothetical protein n=1 Tax=Arthrobacter sp. MYb213 TaxID=1848595 RepID=UPI000CFD7A6F|nr:hypothetical protein [Arthrobacter sp. MYb213]PRB72621.1 hypothetical protein CQ011_02995 [Arthrobacter sp. MYb213]